MSTAPLATLRDVGKQYVKYEDVPTLLTGVRHLMKRGRRGRLWAVRHLDLEVGHGESIGIIGRNGSGKSTTLAMLAGVTAPTEGVVRVRGRLAPLLQLGVGFDQELTGRENVFVNGTILGMSASEIRGSFDEIVAFSEMADFIDTPVKFYSSGMVVRLGFAAAVAAEPDLLIVDEVLAVGDVAFQIKSFERMLAMRERGTTIVVVSHNMSSIRQLADSVVVLHQGEVRYRGAPSEGISLYHDLLRQSVVTGDVDPSDVVRVLSFDMYGADGRPTANVPTGEEVTFRMHVRFAMDAANAAFGVAIATESGQFVYGENSLESIHRDYAAGEEHVFKITLPMNLNSGSYTASCAVNWGSVVKHKIDSPAKVFYVSGRPLTLGIVDLRARFELDSPEGEVADGESR